MTHTRTRRRLAACIGLFWAVSFLLPAKGAVPDQRITPDDPVPAGAQAGPSAESDALDVLFVGNSYSACAGGQPSLFEAFMRSRGKPCRVAFYSRAGETLEGFAIRNRGEPGELTFFESQSLKALGETERAAKLAAIAGQRAETKGKLSEAIGKGPWDAVVLQVWADASQPEEMNFHRHVADLVGLIREGSPEAKIILYMVWSSQNDPAKQAAIEVNVLQAARANRLGVAPAGPAMWKALPLRDDWRFFRTPQDSHPGYEGGYLIACSIYAALTGESPVGLPATLELPASYDFPVPVKTPERDRRIAECGPGPTYPLALAPEKAALLQEIAWETYRKTAAALAAPAD